VASGVRSDPEVDGSGLKSLLLYGSMSSACPRGSRRLCAAGPGSTWKRPSPVGGGAGVNPEAAATRSSAMRREQAVRWGERKANLFAHRRDTRAALRLMRKLLKKQGFAPSNHRWGRELLFSIVVILSFRSAS